MTNSNNSATASASVVFPFSTIAVVFLIIAKLQNLWSLGDLSWWWVFAPYWLPFVVFLGIFLILGVLALLGFGVSEVFKSRKAKKRVKKRAELKKQFDEGVIDANELRRKQRLL